MDIPVVVAAFNRHVSLVRLLSSLLKAHYEKPVKLIVSIDGEGPLEVVKAAKLFQWPFGEKQVVVHEKNLGLRNHILFCGGLTKQYDGIVLLEDDLYVSPRYYDYVMHAARYYRASPDISGIALYSHRYNESACLPFYPLNDGYDIYFMQIACSWGQVWLKEQWREFEDWYKQNIEEDLSNDCTLPHDVKRWPNTSWKKYFIKYMVERKRYFVYPRYAFSTNFGDAGQHHKGTHLFQVPLIHGEKQGYHFVDFEKAAAKYDVFCEIEPEALSGLSQELQNFEFSVDLYGIKEKAFLDKEYVLTSKQCEGFYRSYGKHLIPMEYNIIASIPGNDLFLSKVEQVKGIDRIGVYIHKQYGSVEQQKYFYNIENLHYHTFRSELKILDQNLCEAQKRHQMMQNQLNAIQRSFLCRFSNLLHKLTKKIKNIVKKIVRKLGVI